MIDREAIAHAIRLNREAAGANSIAEDSGYKTPAMVTADKLSDNAFTACHQLVMSQPNPAHWRTIAAREMASQALSREGREAACCHISAAIMLEALIS